MKVRALIAHLVDVDPEAEVYVEVVSADAHGLVDSLQEQLSFGAPQITLISR